MKLRKSVFLLSSLMMLSVGVGVTNAWNGNTVNVAEAAETTVTLSTFTATSADMDSVISYTTDKGGGTTAPAVNSGAIRLYQNSAGTGGGTITISCAENYDITSVTIGSSMATSIAYTLNGGTTKSSTSSLSANGKYTYNAEKCDSITFHCMGKDKNSRLYVNYLSVTYDVEAGAVVDPVEEAFILFDGGEHGTATIESAETTNLKYTLPDVTDVDAGWKFTGWYDENDQLIGLADEEVNFEEGAEVILTAKYKEIPQGMVYDVLNKAFTGVTSTSYVSWTGKTSESDAVYAGNSAGGNDSIQLRSNNNNSGIVTTSSGGYARFVSVEFHSATSAGRTIDVYGKDSAYSQATDLYGTSQGTLLGSIIIGTNTELEITGDYEYIGLRSRSGALYATEIQIGWEAATPSATYEVTINGGVGTFVEGFQSVYEGTTGGESIFVTLPTMDQILNPYVAQGVTTSVSFTSKLGTHNPGDVVEVSEKTEFTAVYTYSDSTVTVAQALEIAKLTGTTNTTFNVTINGTVDSIDTVYSDQYNNISFNIADDSSEEVFLCYRVSGGRELAVGDEISVTGKLVNYNSTTPEMTSGGKFTYLSEKALFNYQYDDDTTPTAVRFIGTVANVDLATVESVTLHFVKDSVAANKDVQVYTLYTSVAGQAEFAEAANTYYVVYVLNGVQSVLNQSLEVTMTVTFNNGAEALVATRTFTLGA